MDRAARLAALGCDPALTPADVGTLTTPALVLTLRALLIAGRVPIHRGQGEDGLDAAWSLFLACIKELVDRGLDADSLVRYGLLPEVFAPLIGEIIVRAAVGDAWPEDDSVGDLPSWKRALGLSNQTTLAGADIANLLSTLSSPLMAWIAAAPLRDIFEMRAPESAWLQQARSEYRLEQHLFSDYRWLVERNAVADLKQWQTDSLHRERRWSDSKMSPPCPGKIMDETRIDATQLNAEVSRRAVYRPLAPNTLTSMSAKVQDQALSFLRQKRFPEASALFEFSLREMPDDAQIVNNLGFCLLPKDVQSALFHLERAHALGYAPASLNTYNRIVGHIKLGQERIARNLAEGYWATEFQDEHAPVPATVWRLGDAETLELLETTDVRLEICEAGLRLATDKDDVARWAERRRFFGS